MNLYLIKRTDEWDYDEYSGFLVRATSAEEAQRLVDEETQGVTLHTFHKCSDPRVTTELIGDYKGEGPPEIILSSFHAG